jgi:hypothetical protein
LKTHPLGTLQVGRIGLGAMGISAAYWASERDDEQSVRTIHRALDLGVTLIDTVEIYGPYGPPRCWRRPSTTSNCSATAMPPRAPNGEAVFGVTGVPTATVSWIRVAEAADEAGEDIYAGLEVAQDDATFPFGAHVSVVEVDVETGRVKPLRHIAVDDCGRVLNPLLGEGQQHGGLAQGIAQALYEEVDAKGQPLTSTLTDYRMPSAADLFEFEAVTTETPTHMNALGAKELGVGDDRVDACGAERRRRRAQLPRGAPHRPAVHPAAGLAGGTGGRQRRKHRPVA